MSHVLTPDLQDLLARALGISRHIETHYLARSVAPGKFPRSVGDFLKIVRTLYPKVPFRVQLIDLKERNKQGEVKGAILFFHGSEKQTIIAVPTSTPDEMRFTTCRATFEVLLRATVTELIDDQRSLRAKVDQLIIRSWEASLSETRDAPPTDLSVLLADIAAAEFLFPYRERLKLLAHNPDSEGVKRAALTYEIPESVVRNYLSQPLIETFRGMSLLTPPTAENF